MCVCAALGVAAAFGAGVSENKDVDVTSAAIRCAEVGKVVFADGFADKANWEKPSWNSACMTLDFGGALGNALAMTVTTNKPKGTHWDTYWRMKSKPVLLPSGARRFLLTFEVQADYAPVLSCGGWESKSWRNAIFWNDADGKEVGETPLCYSASGAGFAEVRITGDIPSGAATGSIQLGFDSPNIPMGKRLEYRALKLSVLDAKPTYAMSGVFASEVRRGGDVSWKAETPRGTSVRFQVAVGDTPEAAAVAPFVGPDGTDRSYYTRPFAVDRAFCRYRAELLSDGRATSKLASVTVGNRTDGDWSLLRDVEPPVVHLASASPFQDPQQPLAFRITDETFVRSARLRVTVDGRDRTADVTRKGSRLELSAPPEGWTNGLHTATVYVEDFRGRGRTAQKVFYRGEMPKSAPVTLRGDGALLLDGKPVFPIGACHVRKCAENGEDLDKAMSELSAAGFNMVQSWWDMYTPRFRNTLRKYGLKCYFGIRSATPFAIETGRHSDEIVAWYIADDTSDNTTPAELLDRHEMLKAIDPNHLTVHASGMDSLTEVSGFRPYADKCDFFLPESYPLQVQNPDSETNCVAAIVRDMRKFFEETALAKDGRPHAAWPLIQYFDRKTLWNPPTPEEYRGMCQAAIVNGAKGLFVYAYKDVREVPERWRTVCEVASDLRELTPVLLDETAAPEATVTVTKGPKLDAYNHPTVTCLVKRHGDELYVLTVNARRERVTANIRLAGECVVGDAKLWHGTETFKVASDNSWTVDYPPHGVRTFVLKAR